MNLTLLVAVGLLLVWGGLVFVVHQGAGPVHLLYAAGIILLARRIIVGAPSFRS